MTTDDLRRRRHLADKLAAERLHRWTLEAVAAVDGGHGDDVQRQSGCCYPFLAVVVVAAVAVGR